MNEVHQVITHNLPFIVKGTIKIFFYSVLVFPSEKQYWQGKNQFVIEYSCI